MKIKKQAQSRDCFVCGVQNTYGLHMKFYEAEPGVVEANYTVDEHFQGYPGVVHGGIIASKMDEAMGRVFMGDNPPRFMVTAELKIRYRKPVPTSQPLVIRGVSVSDNGRVGRAIGTIHDSKGQLLVEGEIVVADIPQTLNPVDDYSNSGWQVYPD